MSPTFFVPVLREASSRTQHIGCESLCFPCKCHLRTVRLLTMDMCWMRSLREDISLSVKK